MLIENIMYFALGFLASGLLALVLLPAVWKRAVRLTRRRIEAATPITLAEFRADKDQLRAEFALTTRKLEQTIEALRARLAEQLAEVNQARADVGAMKVERERHAAELAERDVREDALRTELAESERRAADFAQQLRMRERDLEARSAELAELRDTIRGDAPASLDVDGDSLTGEYDEDVERLTTALAIERKRSSFLEEQARDLVARLENSDRRSAEANAAIAQMREALASRDERKAAAELEAAEARIASAETRLNEILGEEQRPTDAPAPLLAQTLGEADALAALRDMVLGVENAILSGKDVDRTKLRDQLGDIAGKVSRIVYASDQDAEVPAAEESLFDRVQRFADEDLDDGPAEDPQRRVSERMTALQEILGR
jgi:DNA repair exonuclease SbcCD ATPase subunit